MLLRFSFFPLLLPRYISPRNFIIFFFWLPAVIASLTAMVCAALVIPLLHFHHALLGRRKGKTHWFPTSFSSYLFSLSKRSTSGFRHLSLSLSLCLMSTRGAPGGDTDDVPTHYSSWELQLGCVCCSSSSLWFSERLLIRQHKPTTDPQIVYR